MICHLGGSIGNRKGAKLGGTLPERPVQIRERLQRPRTRLRELPLAHQRIEARRVLHREETERLRHGAVAETHGREHLLQEGRVRHADHETLPDQLQRLRRERDHLGLRIRVDPADALDARLQDLAVVVVLRTVDRLVIINLFLPAEVRLDDAERHIRLQRQQRTIKVREGDQLTGLQKIPVVRVEIVRLKFRHLELPVAEALVKLIQFLFRHHFHPSCTAPMRPMCSCIVWPMPRPVIRCSATITSPRSHHSPVGLASTPFVLGISFAKRVSISTASRSTCARPLKQPSAM